MQTDGKFYEEFYEEFHKGSKPLGYVPTKDDFTYGNPIDFVDRQIPAGSKVLDVGCGSGAISLHIATRRSSVVGVDVSERAISAAKDDAERFGLSNARFFVGNINNVELEEKFDVVVCFDVLEHMEDDGLVLRKINRFLEIDGKLLLRVPSDGAPMHKLRLFLRGYDAFDKQVGHLRRYAKGPLKSLLEQTGFRVLEVEDVEGLFRNSVFTTRLGSIPKLHLRNATCSVLFSRLDDLSRRVLGGSGLNVSSSKVTEAGSERFENDKRKS